jgi:two-component system, sporulation sensor kinase D
MNIYSKKQRWKLVLTISALVIASLSLWYTNILVKKIAAEEREKVKLWADAIQKKAKLVKYTQDLFNKLKTEEHKRMEMWADATRMLLATENDADRNFYLKIVNSNFTIPVILTDEKNQITSWRNIDGLDSEKQLSQLTQLEKTILFKQFDQMKKSQDPIEIPYYRDFKQYLYFYDSKVFSELKVVLDDLLKSFISEIVVNSATVPVLYTDHTGSHVIAAGNIDPEDLQDSVSVRKVIDIMAAQNQPIVVELDGGERNVIYYQESLLLTQLKFYPYVQLGIFGVFLLVAYSLFSTARKSEQNQVWVGMAKETAHQLGTPLSSLIAWVELLRLKGVEEEVTTEIEKDIKRLETITERFSKIGSQPELKPENVVAVMKNSLSYLQMRVSNKVAFHLNSYSDNITAPINIPLFEWVIENLCKNAIDAMNGSGSITVDINENVKDIFIDITDSGKGIPKSNLKTVFQPGYTTKKRGWGLGLTLVKRIIEIYHSGKIFVKKSELNKGTTFRIILNK